MNNLSIPIKNTIRDWLLFVGAEHGIFEAHYGIRKDDLRKNRRDHFVFRFDSSSTEQVQAIDNSSFTDNDATMQHLKPFMRQLVIECHSEDGMDILEALNCSVQNPGAGEILTAGCLVAVSIGDIVDITEWDDSPYEEPWVYTATYTIRKEGAFTKVRTNHIVDDVSLTGTLTADSGDTHTVTATASRT